MGMTTAEAREYESWNFVQKSYEVIRQYNCYQEWTELLVRRDGKPATEEDVAILRLCPRGQGHSVKLEGDGVRLHCICDSGD